MRIIFFSIFCFVAFNLGANPSLSALNAPCTADAYNNSCGSTFYNVYKVKLDTNTISLFWKDSSNTAYGSFDFLTSSLKKQSRTLLFALNSGLFCPVKDANGNEVKDASGNKVNKPCGLHIENGTELVKLNRDAETGADNLHTRPGVFYITSDNKAHIVTRDTFISSYDNNTSFKQSINIAVQSGPMFVDNGTAKGSDTTSHVIRALVCTFADNTVGLILSNSVSPCCVGRDLLKLGCNNAMMLDGAIVQGYFDGIPDMSGTLKYNSATQKKSLVGIIGVE